MRRSITFTGVPALVVLAAVFALQWWAIDSRGDRYDRNRERTQTADSRQAALLAAELTYVQSTLRARSGRFAGSTSQLTDAYLDQYTERLGRPVLEDHRVSASAGPHGYRLEVSARPGGGPAFRVAFDESSGQTTASCDPAPGCREGRWSPADLLD